AGRGLAGGPRHQAEHATRLAVDAAGAVVAVGDAVLGALALDGQMPDVVAGVLGHGGRGQGAGQQGGEDRAGTGHAFSLFLAALRAARAATAAAFSAIRASTILRTRSGGIGASGVK